MINKVILDRTKFERDDKFLEKMKSLKYIFVGTSVSCSFVNCK